MGIGARRAALVGRWTALSARGTMVDGRAGCPEGLRLRGTAVVGQGAEQRVRVGDVSRLGEIARCVAGEVIAAIAEAAGQVTVPTVGAVGHNQTLAARASAVEPGHFGRRPGFVDKHQIIRPPFALLRPPLLASFRYVGAILLCGALRLFLSVSPRCRIRAQRQPTLTFTA